MLPTWVLMLSLLDQMLEILLPFAYLSLFLYVIRKSSFFDCVALSKKSICLFFLLKVVAGFGVWYTYTYYYPDRSKADIFKYFDDAKVIYSAIPENVLDYFKILFGIDNDNTYFDKTYYHKMNSWSKTIHSSFYNESHTIIRFNAFALLFSLGSYHVHTVFMSFLSLVGLIGIYKAISPYFRDRELLIKIPLFLLPSTLFWTSGVLKEGILIFCLGATLYFITNALTSRSRSSSLLFFGLLIVSLYLLVLTKMYAIIALIPSLVAWIISDKFHHSRRYITFLVTNAIYCVSFFLLDSIVDWKDLVHLIYIKNKEFIELAIDENAGSLIRNIHLEPTTSSILLNLPLALFNVLFRPLFFDATNALSTVASLETLVFIVVLLFLFTKGKVRLTSTPSPIFLCFFFSMISLAVVGLTTPILGAIVRYKSVIIPFLLISIVYYLPKESIEKLKQLSSLFR